MPQMSPLNWWFLFMNFIIILIMFNILNYYIYTYTSPNKKSTNLISKSLNWKW
uniref:ATP synthase complex subunit 8 n=1 Tax=Isoscelipteron pectinatum TaxID=2856572 RepID=A0A8F8PJY6_9NEOP|nr:ATP synthase F0 subunit 8 [Isoscelipteron pectinatum]